ncbi:MULTISPECIES: hypothetical protein [Acinetobacter]|uniref:hypothetical protein n=1 Tax=Acinetobacter TaxID=469 RepID=UPI0015D2793E|nr:MULTISPECIES: hypothetical protein [Acinetobacter]MCL6238492.1 hypothetical protein [Acinetobacter amyesii]
MAILNYETGPIQAEAAFTSDFPVASEIKMHDLVNMQEIERRSMDVRPGMRHKYMPLGFDRFSGALWTGGRYLFDTWENVKDYERFTSEELEFEPNVKFWSRPFFLNVQRYIWRVAGAHDFKPLATSHHVVRFERFSTQHDQLDQLLKEVWPTLREQAQALGLSSAWLMFNQDEKQVSIVTVAAKVDTGNAAEDSIKALAKLESMSSLSELLPSELKLTPLFDRTNPILAQWLPLSRVAGGEPSAHPMSPPLAAPTVEPQK